MLAVLAAEQGDDSAPRTFSHSPLLSSKHKPCLPKLGTKSSRGKKKPRTINCCWSKKKGVIPRVSFDEVLPKN